MLFIFDGGTVTAEQLGAIQFRNGEITEYTFATAADIDNLTIPRLARRLHATLAAHAQRLPTYLEEGASPTEGGGL